MSCNCIKTVKTNAIVDLGAILVLVITPQTFRKREEFRFVICQTLPASTPGLDPMVVIFDGTNLFPVFNRFSEFVRRSNIECRTCYRGIVSNDPLHIQLCGLTDTCLCPNELVTPTTAVAIGEVTLEAIVAAAQSSLSALLASVSRTTVSTSAKSTAK